MPFALPILSTSYRKLGLGLVYIDNNDFQLGNILVSLYRQSCPNASVGLGGKIHRQVVNLLHLRFEYRIPERSAYTNSTCSGLQDYIWLFYLTNFQQLDHVDFPKPSEFCLS